MHGTGEATEVSRSTESRRKVRCGRRCFAVSPGSIPLNINTFSKQGRDLHVIEEAVYNDCSE